MCERASEISKALFPHDETRTALQDQEQANDPEPKLDDAMGGDYFGNCPVCGACGSYLNIGRVHVFYCEEHKIQWGVGSNLFSSWRDETEEIGSAT